MIIYHNQDEILPEFIRDKERIMNTYITDFDEIFDHFIRFFAAERGLSTENILSLLNGKIDEKYLNVKGLII